MIDFIDLTMIKELEEWRLDKALNTCEERLERARQDLIDLYSWEALEDDIAACEKEVNALVNCRGHIRAEFQRRRPNRINFT